MQIERTDPHCPKNIVPSDYEFVAFGYQKMEHVGDVMEMAEERQAKEAHMAATGGKIANHEHGGNCHVCGATFIYYQIFYHVPSNTYIHVGNECAEKLHYSNPDGFKKFIKNCKEALANKAGKAKARQLVDSVSGAWELYETKVSLYKEAKGTSASCQVSRIHDIICTVIRTGRVSEKQLNYLKILVDQEKNRPAFEAQKAAEEAARADCPKGKITVDGIVLKVEEKVTDWGCRFVMTVKDDSGFMVWGTVPSSVEMKIQKGGRIQFTANVEPSDKDPKFGFFKRPTKASVKEMENANA